MNRFNVLIGWQQESLSSCSHAFWNITACFVGTAMSKHEIEIWNVKKKTPFVLVSHLKTCVKQRQIEGVLF